MATASRTAPYRALPAAPRQASRIDITVYLAVALGYMLLLPPQLNLTIGSTVLPPYRFFLIPAVLFMLAKGIRGQIRFGWADLMIVLATAWVSFALFMTTNASEAFTAAVAQTTDIGLAYFFGRFTLRNLRDLRLFLLFMLPGLAVMGGIMVVESVIHRPILQDLVSSVVGKRILYQSDLRLGLFRSPGPFPHPILAGVFMSSFLPLYLMIGLRGWPRIMGAVAALCSFFTVSSAALLGLIVGGALVAYNWLSDRIANLTWRLFFVAAGIFVFLAEAGTGAGTFGLIMRYASLNSVSSYNRVLIWKYGTQNVASNPWFGLGYADWERPVWMVASLDHFWLLMAVRFGIIPPVLVAIAVILAVMALMRSSTMVGLVDQRALRGVAISLGVFAFGIISVALWLSAHIWFFMLIGFSVSIAANVQDRAAAIAFAQRRQRPAPPPPPRVPV